MKYTLLILVALICFGCSKSTTQGTQTASAKNLPAEPQNGPVEERLANMLRKQSGVIVSQTSNSYAVKVRGVNTLQGSSSPLFVIDGITMGTDFNTAAQAIAGNQIRSVRVLKGQEASFYGTNGSGGVVIVKTRKPEPKE